jgi:hypothetical protein
MTCIVCSWPQGFGEAFADASPALYARLAAEEEGFARARGGAAMDVADGAAAPRPGGPTPGSAPPAGARRVSLADVRLWMWKLFLDDHGPARPIVFYIFYSNQVEVLDRPAVSPRCRSLRSGATRPRLSSTPFSHPARGVRAGASR